VNDLRICFPLVIGDLRLTGGAATGKSGHSRRDILMTASGQLVMAAQNSSSPDAEVKARQTKTRRKDRT
jgi:hypothetical protein